MSNPRLALWNPVILLLHMSSPIAKFVESSREEIVKQTPNQSPIFAISAKYLREKNMVDVIFFGSTVGSHRISNEVRRNNVVVNVLNPIMRNFGFGNRVHWPIGQC